MQTLLPGADEVDTSGSEDFARDLAAFVRSLRAADTSGRTFDDDVPRAVFRAELGSDDVEWERSKAWAFVQALGAVWYYVDTNPATTRMGRATRARVAASTSGAGRRLTGSVSAQICPQLREPTGVPTAGGGTCCSARSSAST